MRVLYISTLCAKETYREMFGYSTASPGFAVQKYHNVMVKGLAENGAEVICVTAPPVSPSNFKKRVADLPEVVESGLRFSYVKVLNLPLIKNLSVYKNTKNRCLELLKESTEKGEYAGIVLDLLCISACKGALSAQKKFKKQNYKSAGIVTDLPAFLHTDKTGLKGKIFGKIFGDLFNKNLKACSSYVLLTEQMNTLLNKGGKPYAIIEGQADENVPAPKESQDTATQPRIVMYAGSLAKIYGIVTLAESFGELNPENAELHIYGGGDALEELADLSAKYPQVKYKGVLANDEIVEKEQEAILLVNPRPSSEEFTKYSFPSKNMEYMASGTAVLTTDLPGMPAEYREYVYIIEDESKEGVKAALLKVLSKPDNEIRQKGLLAREFVLANKSSKVQARKVLGLLK